MVAVACCYIFTVIIVDLKDIPFCIRILLVIFALLGTWMVFIFCIYCSQSKRIGRIVRFLVTLIIPYLPMGMPNGKNIWLLDLFVDVDTIEHRICGQCEALRVVRRAGDANLLRRLSCCSARFFADQGLAMIPRWRSHVAPLVCDPSITL